MIYLAFFVIGLFSCSYTNGTKENERVDNGLQDTCIEKFIPDTAVNDIVLCNNNTLAENGIEALENHLVEENGESLPFVSFLNSRGTEKLTVYFFYGSGYDEFYQFKIEPYEAVSSSLNPKRTLNFDRFVTNSEVELGISKAALEKIKGSGFVRNSNVISYTLSDYDKSCFLQKYNIPIYFS